MISKAYEKADLKIIEFSLEDVLSSSAVVHTTTVPSTTVPTTTLPQTTHPATTEGGVQVGTGTQGDVKFDFSDFFQ